MTGKRGVIISLVLFTVALLFTSTLFFSGAFTGEFGNNQINVDGMLLYNPANGQKLGKIIGNDGSVYSVEMNSDHLIAERGSFTLKKNGQTWIVTNEKLEAPVNLITTDGKVPLGKNVIVKMNAVSVPLVYNGTYYTIGISTNLTIPVLFIYENSLPLLFNNITVTGLYLSAENLTKYFGLNLSVMEKQLLQVLINITLGNNTKNVILATNIMPEDFSSVSGQILAEITPANAAGYINGILGGILNSSGFQYIGWIINHTEEQLFIVYNASSSIKYMELDLIMAPLDISSSELEGLVTFKYSPSYLNFLSEQTGLSFDSRISIKIGAVNDKGISSSGYIPVDVNNLWGINSTGVDVKGFLVGFTLSQAINGFSDLLEIPSSLRMDILNFTERFNVGVYILINKDLTFSLNTTFLHGFALLIVPDTHEKIGILTPADVQGVVYNARDVFNLNFTFPILISSSITLNVSFSNAKGEEKIISGMLISDPSLTSKFNDPFKNISLILTDRSSGYQDLIIVHNNLNTYFVNGTITLVRDRYEWWSISSIVPSPVIKFDEHVYQVNKSYYMFKNIIMTINTTSVAIFNQTFGIDADNYSFVWFTQGTYPMINSEITLNGVFLPEITINVGKILRFFEINISGLEDFLDSLNVTISGLGNTLFLANSIAFKSQVWNALDIIAKVTPSTIIKYLNNEIVKIINGTIGTKVLNIINKIINNFNEEFLLAISSNYSIYNQHYYLLLAPDNTPTDYGIETLKLGVSNINFTFSIGSFHFTFTVASVIPSVYRIPVFVPMDVEDLWNTNIRNVDVYGFAYGFTLKELMNWTLPLFSVPAKVTSMVMNITKYMNAGIFLFFNQDLKVSLNRDAYRSIAFLVVPNFTGNPGTLTPYEIKGVLFNSSSLFGLPSSLNFPIIFAKHVISNPVFPTQMMSVSGLMLAYPQLTSTFPAPFTDMALVIVDPWSANPSLMFVHSVLPHYAINGTITLIRDIYGWWNISSIAPSPFINIDINANSPSTYAYKNVIVSMNTTSLAAFGYTFGLNQALTPPYVWIAEGSYPLFDTGVRIAGVFLSSINLNISRILSVFHINLPVALDDLCGLLNITISGLGNYILLADNISGMNVIRENVQIIDAFTPDNLYAIVSEYAGSTLSSLLTSSVLESIYNFINNTEEQVLIGFDTNNTITNMTFYLIFAPLNINPVSLAGASEIMIVKSNLYLSIDSEIKFSIIVGSVLNNSIVCSGYDQVNVSDLWGMNGRGVSVRAWAVGIDAFQVTSFLDSQFQQYFNLDISMLEKMAQALDPAIFVLMDPTLFFNTTTSIMHDFALAIVPNYPYSLSTLGFFTFSGVVYDAGYFFNTGWHLPVLMVGWIGDARPNYQFVSLPQLAYIQSNSLAYPISTTGLITGTTLKEAGNILSTWISGLSVINYCPLDIGIYILSWSSPTLAYNVPVVYPVLGVGSSYLAAHVDVTGYYVNYTEAILWLETLIGINTNTTFNVGKYLTYLLNSELSSLGLTMDILNGFIIATGITYNYTQGTVMLAGYVNNIYVNSSVYQQGVIDVPIYSYLTDNSGLSLKFQFPEVYYTIVTPNGESFSGSLNSNIILFPFFADNMSGVVSLPVEIGTYTVYLYAYAYYGWGDLLATTTFYFTVTMKR